MNPNKKYNFLNTLPKLFNMIAINRYRVKIIISIIEIPNTTYLNYYVKEKENYSFN